MADAAMIEARRRRCQRCEHRCVYPFLQTTYCDAHGRADEERVLLDADRFENGDCPLLDAKTGKTRWTDLTPIDRSAEVEANRLRGIAYQAQVLKNYVDAFCPDVKDAQEMTARLDALSAKVAATQPDCGFYLHPEAAAEVVEHVTNRDLQAGA